ncbi:unnamed protein product [Commensalibacter communis]|uniref:DUF4184 family protein n=1 Tax=Commensalibacter communis TaxID=2972786 RepID=A0A9W4XHH5_9PROT|nr:DUF4184 family protein [Commensalibacter communis]CAI3925885.1 unnamed protein product [Commensalibacter communis]CAI3926434.1 unnamed protein product [Commensalibacter communis]CAI3934938.1 unnamed protein product [Commensalibacter communis]CAI3936552.1 unnamed protein product [Commensalibacter communis]
MPWTFSHPAVVFPIKQSKIGKFLNLPALIIGSIFPDLFYSVGLFKLATKAHHIIGWFYTAFPLCVLLFIILSIFSTNLNKILPITIEPCKQWGRSNCLIIIFSLFIGAVTHIVWDGFTHETGNFVKNIHFLQYNLIETISNRQELRIYKFLQYAGSVLGLLYLCLKYTQYQKKLNPDEQKQNIIKLYQLCKLAILSIGISLPFAYFLTRQYKIFNINKFIFNELRIAELVFFAFIFIIALWIKYRKNET